MKILIFGAGVLGSLFASRLKQAGQDVTLLARGKRLSDLKKYGIVIKEDGSDKEEVTQVNLVDTFSPEDYYDLVILVMGYHQIKEIIPVLGANKSVPTFLFMGNNLKGPLDLVESLGGERVMLGFPYPGGERDGHIIKSMRVDEKKKYTLPIGEVDGQVIERTKKVAEVLGAMRGYKVQIRTDMDAWLKYHVAFMISGLLPALLASGINMKRLGRTRDLIVLAIRATKEAMAGLEEAGIPPSPSLLKTFNWIPEPILVYLIGKFMKKEVAKTSIEGHTRAAPDEMKYLFDELKILYNKIEFETPNMDKLSKYFDPNTPLFPDGKSEIPMEWKGIVIPLSIIIVLVIFVLFL